jgi:hypothetical protein
MSSSPLLIRTPVIVQQKRDIPGVEIRRLTTDIDLCKEIIRAAFHDEPLTILPQFCDKVKSLASLQEKGIIYWDPEQEQWYFNI